MEPKRYSLWFILLILMMGIYLRWAALEPMSSMSHYDEAWNWGDATEIIAQPYFTLRYTATVTGILTLAAIYRLGRANETIIQTFSLTLPSDMSSSSYQIALGIYHFPDGARLPISQPTTAASADNAFMLHQFGIAE